MSVFSNSSSSVYWSNPDSNFNFTNGGINTIPLINRYASSIYPLVVDNNNIAITGGIGGLGYGGLGLGFPAWGMGLWNF